MSRLDGTFGVNGLVAGSQARFAGGLAGMAKTAGHEWRGSPLQGGRSRPGFESTEQAAAAIVDELFERGPAEVGITRQGTHRAGAGAAVRSPTAADRRPSRLERGDLVVISGGARGITAEVAVALAESFQPRLVLLGRSPAPSPRKPTGSPGSTTRPS